MFHMNRRQLLAGVSLTPVLFAGCLTGDPTGADTDTNPGDGNTSDTGEDHEVEYERCDRTFPSVHFDLPEPAEEEANSAIDDGPYETSDSLVLPQAIDINDAYVTRNDGDDVTRYYAFETEDAGDVTRLRATETFPETTPVSVRNNTEEDLTAEIRHLYAQTMDTDADVAAEGDVLVEKTLEIEAGDEVELNGDVEYRFGGYWAALDVEELGVEAELDWQMSHEWSGHGTLHLGRGQEHVGRDERVFYEDSTHNAQGEMASCEWADDGELLEGPGAD
ncbi:MAG: hypothetical protein ACOC06_02595 [Halorubrum sp.]